MQIGASLLGIGMFSLVFLGFHLKTRPLRINDNYNDNSTNDIDDDNNDTTL